MTGNEPPAGTPPADPAGGQPPATPPAQPGQNPQGDVWTPAHQAIFDRRFAEKMSAIETELGLPQGGFKDFVATQMAAQKSKLPTGETLSGADLKIARMEALMTVGVSSKQIPLLLQHLNISGKTREEIQASVGQLIELKLLTIEAPAQQGTQQQPPGPPNVAQGAGNNGVPGNNGPKIWTRQEVVALQKNNPAEYEKHRMEILEQMSKGLVK